MPKENVFSLFGRVGHERGLGREAKVDEALCLLQEGGLIDGFKKSERLDAKGIDRLVEIGSKKYKLSVKSSKGGVAREIKEHPKRFRHGDVIFIIPRSDENPVDLSERIMRLIDEQRRRYGKR